MVDRMKLPVHFFTSTITTIPVTIAITIDAIAATNKEIENVCTEITNGFCCCYSCYPNRMYVACFSSKLMSCCNLD